MTDRRTRKVVTVTASQVFTAKWLLPRLDSFSSRHGGIDVRLDVSDSLADLVNGEADIAVRCGVGPWPDLLFTQLKTEEVIAVCSPSRIKDGDTNVSVEWLS